MTEIIGVLFIALGLLQQPTLPLGEIQVTGTKRFTAADIAKVSGLKVGQPASAADFDATAKRMAGTGLFKRVAFRYAAPSGKWILTFEVEDLDWNMAVAFDNFIWFSDDQLTQAVRESVPTYAGLIPQTPEATATMASALQRLLQSKSIPGHVEIMPEGDLRAMKGYVAKVVDPAPPVCTWTFNGAAAIAPKELESELTSAGPAYSKTFVERASKGTLLTLYRRLGYWRAAVSEPVTALAKTASCDGVSVAITVTEGTKYAWAGAEWTGNATIPSADLNQMLAMKTGDTAALRLIEDGVRRLGDAYGTKGYITARATFAERLDDAQHTATFAFTVQEGQQYHMGTLEFPGLPPADAAELTKRWRLKSGDAFDASYPSKFFIEEIRPRLPRGTPAPATQTRADPQQRTVDVRFVFGAR